ncbi:FAD-binding domain-containing protein [Exidia glandulosa HHB12029]|uniref:D-lactate dehydrogenase (cytochrome) n=1 Tax=Exidia glandulosa HHB12029 TaxID=1314781 RepID=A0A165FAU0_EXIGL|nr:FAD-binding domain-containing protein [Exidia glandulosa HHB12029]
MFRRLAVGFRIPRPSASVQCLRGRLLSTRSIPLSSASQRWQNLLLGTFIGTGLGVTASWLAYGSGFLTTSVSDYGSQYGSTDDFRKALEELQHALPPASVSTLPADLTAMGSVAPKTTSSHGVVVRPTSTNEVQHVVLVAKKYRIPVVVHGSGTSLEGQANPLPGVHGICVDLSAMDRILEVNEADCDLVCQPGTSWNDINVHLSGAGIPLFFPLDPGPGASVGGMISTGCSGTNAVRYGTARAEWILNMTVVLPSGKIIKTRSRARKSSAGFDLTKLFIGAEGTLGIITEVTLRLAPVVPTTVATVQFRNVADAVSTVLKLLNLGVPLQCAELLDSVTMRSINLAGGAARKYDDADALFLKIQNPTRAILDTVKATCEAHYGTRFELATSPEDADVLWADRKNAYFSNYALMPGARGMATDICVPVSRLPQFILETKADLDAHGIIGPIVGHVGDGNFHSLLLHRTPEEEAKAQAAQDRMVKRAIALGGTCTGEHGIGVTKKKYLKEELGEDTVELMHTLKRAVDPHNLFNPGKLYP